MNYWRIVDGYGAICKQLRALVPEPLTIVTASEACRVLSPETPASARPQLAGWIVVTPTGRTPDEAEADHRAARYERSLRNTARTTLAPARRRIKQAVSAARH